MDLLGSLFSAGSNLLGGYFGNQESKKIADENIAEQEKFAQQGIQWKVADAKAAGINPLAALGASTSSFSNVVGSDNSMGRGIAGAGQDIGRAIQAMQSPEDKALATYKTKLDLESMQLDNDIKRAHFASSIAKAHQPGTPPGVATETTTLPDRAFSRTADGGWAVMPSKEVQDRNYGMIGEASTAIRNRVAGFIDPVGTAPPVPLEKGKHWTMNPITGVWYQEAPIFDLPAWWHGRR